MAIWCDVITTDVAVGNALAGAIGTSPDDNKTFDYGVRLRTIGGPNVEVARSTGGWMSYSVASLIQEFLTNGPYTNLNAAGVTNEMVAAGKAALAIRLAGGPEGFDTFWASLGYEPLVIDIGAPQ